MARNYKREYANYQSKPNQKKRRASRNTARNRALAKGTVKKGDTKDVHHRDGNPKNNAKKNLTVKPRSANRSFARNKKAGKK